MIPGSRATGSEPFHRKRGKRCRSRAARAKPFRLNGYLGLSKKDGATPHHNSIRLSEGLAPEQEHRLDVGSRRCDAACSALKQPARRERRPPTSTAERGSRFEAFVREQNLAGILGTQKSQVTGGYTRERLAIEVDTALS